MDTANNSNKFSRVLTSMSLVKTLWDKKQGQDIISLYVSLVIQVIDKNQFTSVTADSLQKPFEDEFGYSIPRQPMCTILQRAKHDGLLSLDHGEYHVVKEQIQAARTGFNESTKLQRSMKNIVMQFIQYAHEKHGKEISETEAEETLLNYLKTHDHELLFCADSNTVLPETTKNQWEKFLLSNYIIWLSENNTALFEDLLNIAMGHIIASTILFEGEEERDDSTKIPKPSYDGKFKDINFYFDTKFLIYLLGLGPEERQAANEDLINALKSNGASLFVFQHVFEEIQAIVDNCRIYAASNAYDESIAKEATIFCRKKNMTRSDLQEFYLNLERKLQEFRIFIVERPDVDKNRKYNIDVDSLYQEIVKIYQHNDSRFIEEEKRRTIDTDVKTIDSIYILRKGKRPVSMNKVTHVFITTNSTLAQIASMFDRDCVKNIGTIPTCLTAIFIGTFVWIQNPRTYSPINKKKIIADCYAMLQPNSELRKRFHDTTVKLLERKEITRDEFTLLKFSAVSDRCLMNRTMGDIEQFDEENTPQEILRDIEKNERESGRRERDDEIDELSKKASKLEEEKSGLQDKIVELDERYKHLDKLAHSFANTWACLVFWVLVAFVIASLVPQFFSLTNVLRWILGALSVISILLSLITGFNIKDFKDSLKDRLYRKRLAKLTNQPYSKDPS